MTQSAPLPRQLRATLASPATERDERIIAMFASGQRFRDIGAAVGLTSSAVSKVLRAVGVPKERRTPTKLTRKDILEKGAPLLAEGMPYHKIARRLKVSETFVRDTIVAAMEDGRLPQINRLEKRNSEIVKLYRGGLSAKEIGGRFDLCDGAIYAVLKSSRVPRRARWQPIA